MSFILDAIAKSEQERRQLEMPGAEVLSIPLENNPQKRRWLPLLVIAALLLNVVIVAVWIRSDKAVDKTIQAIANSAPQEQQNLNKAIENSIVVEEVIVNKQKKTIMPGSVTGSQSPAVEPDETSELEFETTVSIEQEDTDGWVRVEPDSLLNSTKEAGNSSDFEASDMEQLIPSQLYDLPQPVRKDLPTVKFSGHLYSSNPASSVVFLDNQRPVMQGQQIVDEVFLHEITSDGVVVRFRGYLISVGVLQNWTLN